MCQFLGGDYVLTLILNRDSVHAGDDIESHEKEVKLEDMSVIHAVETLINNDMYR